MTEALWKKFTREEITLILNESTSIKELMQKIGYNSKNGGARKQIDKMLEFYNLKLPDYKESYSLTKRVPQERICEICGNVFIIDTLAQRTRKYCYECSPVTNNPTFKARAMKTKVIEMKGGKCERCGYDTCTDALELHHIDPSTKDFKLSNSGALPSFDKYLKEAEKCILLCANCHREEHWRWRQENKVEN